MPKTLDLNIPYFVENIPPARVAAAPPTWHLLEEAKDRGN